MAVTGAVAAAARNGGETTDRRRGRGQLGRRADCRDPTGTRTGENVGGVDNELVEEGLQLGGDAPKEEQNKNELREEDPLARRAPKRRQCNGSRRGRNNRARP
ncbi:unnamed protein product [Cylicostephanus goldi]|uniref:Uncharacterized protein n=1 Tax=Cylicostephanus goldi TaxID=71465 RepID=A0A3P6TBV1_CYLGO|nr:unnamed protein product [Cylicostephanus goldi]